MFAAALEDEETCGLVLECILGASVGRVRVKAERSVLLSADFREIIFICNFDPFGRGLYRYTFEPRCLEADFPLKDGTRRIFLSTKGTNQREVPKELVGFLQYVTNSTQVSVEQAGNGKLAQIHERVKTLKQSRKLEERYMKFEELLKREHEEGHARGTKQMWELVSRIIADGKTDFIPRLKEETFYQEMLKEYHLEI